MPPRALCRSTARYLPVGFRSQKITGTFRRTRSKSSMRPSHAGGVRNGQEVQHGVGCCRRLAMIDRRRRFRWLLRVTMSRGRRPLFGPFLTSNT
jgi:hypothetical protein